MSHWHCPPGRKPLRPIPAEELPRMIGCWIHLAWAKNECRFTLERVDGDKIRVSTGWGGNKKFYDSKSSDARYMRKSKPPSERSAR